MITRGEVRSIRPTGRSPSSFPKVCSETTSIIESDLVVLAVGMVPNSADGELVRELHDSRHQAENSESSQVRENSAARAEELKATRAPRSSISPIVRGQICRPSNTASRTRISSASPTKHGEPVSTRGHRPRTNGIHPGRLRMVSAQRSKLCSASRWRSAARRSTRAPETSPTRTSSSNAAPSANAAPRSAPSELSTRTRRALPSSSSCDAAVAASAWEPVRNASSASRTTRFTGRRDDQVHGSARGLRRET